MFNDPTLTLAGQLFWLVDLFRKTMAREACALRFGAVSVALWTRVRGLERRFSGLYAMWKAGTLPVRAPMRAPLGPSAAKNLDRGERGELRDARGAWAAKLPFPGDTEALGAAQLRPASVLPRAAGWMQKLLPLSAGTLAYAVSSLMDGHPELKPFAEACPEVGRIFRPLCRMAGLTPPEWLALPRRKRGPGLCRAGATAPRLRRTAREIATAAMERSLRTGKPIDPTKMSAVAYGYVLHWPRDGNCPPPEIGYGGRMFPPLPKDYKRPQDD